MIPFLLILSVLPSVLILLYLYKKDKYEQEPLELLLKAFGMGVLSAICVLVTFGILESFMPVDPDTGNRSVDAFITAFFIAAVPEEGFKFLMLYLLIWKNRNFNERFDGILYAVFVSLGFATLENIMYVLQSGAGTAIARALTAVPAHALFGVAMGYYFSYARFLPEREKRYLSFSILIPVVLHGIYDFILFLGASYADTHPVFTGLMTLSFFGFVIFLWVQGFKKIKKLSSDFYFTGIPLSEVHEYYNTLNEQFIIANAARAANTNVSYLKNWYEITPVLFENEKSAIIGKYPDAYINIDDGVVKVTLAVTRNFPWEIQLIYARNYRRLKEQLRIYILQPDMNELVAIADEIPYIKADLSGNYYLDVVSQHQVSGESALDNALLWITLFEKWVEGEIELNEFVIN
jgi:RsiW-degrading membrane proteinase PrsW (M82 family)